MLKQRHSILLFSTFQHTLLFPALSIVSNILIFLREPVMSLKMRSFQEPKHDNLEIDSVVKTMEFYSIIDGTGL